MAREYKRQRGFFTIAQYSDKFGDYPRMAYALALSLKASPNRSILFSSWYDRRRPKNVYPKSIEMLLMK